MVSSRHGDGVLNVTRGLDAHLDLNITISTKDQLEHQRQDLSFDALRHGSVTWNATFYDSIATYVPLPFCYHPVMSGVAKSLCLARPNVP